MAKERMLTVLVPIKDEDAITVTTLPPVSVENINVIYKHEGVYKRVWLNPSTNQYEYHEVVDMEFPYLGKPLEIFDFTYDATRMGNAPTISAQSVMWFADKDENNNDVTLEDLWLERNNDCHVVFNGENLYLKYVPTCTKSNDDARYKYDIDFVSERVVLENVYIYDVVQPFVTERPISESASFSFFGDVSELAKRINSSLLRSGLATLLLKNGVSESDILTYEEWNQIGLGTYQGTKPTGKYEDSEYIEFYPYYAGNYSSYLSGEIYAIVDGDFVMQGYQCKIGKDKYGHTTESEEKLITFENNTIHEALQQFHDTFGLQYFIYSEKNSSGGFTGNTIIMVADCEHDFADIDPNTGNYIRDDDGVPTTEHPFDYGVDKELLSKEKTNTTDKIITRITGVGSEENIPWYYPNPTADGWIKPIYTRGGEETQEQVVEYPTSEGSTIPESVRYEKFLKNRIGDKIVFGRQEYEILNTQYDSSSRIDASNNSAVINYLFSVENGDTGIGANRASFLIDCDYDSNKIQSRSYELYKKNNGVYESTGITFSDETVREFSIEQGEYKLSLEFKFTSGGAPVVGTIIPLYYYPEQRIPLGGLSVWDRLIGRPDYCIIPAFISVDPNIIIFNGGTRENVWLQRSTGQRIFWNDMRSGYISFLGYTPQSMGEDWRYVKHSRTSSSYNDYIDELSTGEYVNGVHLPNDISLYFGVGELETIIIYDVGKKTDNITISVNDFVTRYISIDCKIYHDRWFKNNKRIELPTLGMSLVSGFSPIYGDTISFKRLKYVTPQPTLMPEVYIKTDGERRFYNAVNYPIEGSSPDEMIGEEIEGGKIVNPIYQKAGTSTHYVFENEFIKGRQKEHIEKFDDVKPTIKGQKNTIGISQRVIRIDVVEEFAYDDLDNDEIWEDNNDGTSSGEYKHPYFFAKLRPLGFNIFDLALQEDMVISMTTGSCGSCNFKIGVDEETKKNPVQIWEYDVYRRVGSGYSQAPVYSKGSIRRYVETSDLFYKIGSEYVSVNARTTNTVGFLVPERYSYNQYRVADYSAEEVVNGEVGTMKSKSKIVFEGDVVTRGRYIDSQQDTSENFVWVALMKDTESYGVLIPAARPNYEDHTYDVYIRPKSITDVHTSTSTSSEDEDNADKFVITNIRLPQAYLRNSETELSKRIVAYMYDNNKQKFNFSIKFSRIFLGQNFDVEGKLNENSVVYVTFNNKIYRQYVKHYSYKMTSGEPLPEISVDLNEEMNVSRTRVEQEAALRTRSSINIDFRLRRAIAMSESRIRHRVVERNSDVILNGNLVSRDSRTSFGDLRADGLRQVVNISGNGAMVNDLDITSVKTSKFNVKAFDLWSEDMHNTVLQIKNTIKGHNNTESCTEDPFTHQSISYWYGIDGLPIKGDECVTDLTIPEYNPPS